MRRTPLFLAALTVLGMATAPPATADSVPGAPPTTTGFQPYDLVQSAAATVRAVQHALALSQANVSDLRKYEIVFRFELLDGSQRFEASRSSTTYGLQSRLLFAKDSAKLSSKAGKELGIIAGRIAAARPTEPVQINGYTDNLGSTAHGLKLSRERATAIKRVMEKKAPAVTFQAHGFGEKNPIADNGTEEGRERNRRADIVVPIPGA